jgi:hypothetical protein
LFYNFSAKGTLKGKIANPEPKSEDWLPRIAFDTAYFVWVGIILFTTITALLVDALGKARTEAALRDREEKNVCFMCGLKRPAYDDFNLSSGSPSFDDHCGKEHDPWMYVAYVAHLERRRKLERTGVESFVQKAITSDDNWVPVKTSFVLEAQGKTGLEGGLLKVGGGADAKEKGGKGKAAAAAAAEADMREMVEKKAAEGTAGEIAKLRDTVNEILALQKSTNKGSGNTGGRGRTSSVA